ncbi:O-antigen ligase family protein [Sphingomonas xanthus]|uniref:O-antigen ligase family protein n=1 Tax=Sphingomonas xanthus TaxID=2594473 RepID=A0A516IU90_9SPHN|nr:O-antigen ligase family protein [Sphingomonas xanthus]QDP20452.1 O-antigen ligase family protein [Sphingomonas xanthus]
MLLFWVLFGFRASTIPSRHPADFTTLALALGLPLIAVVQLVPLPPSIWQSLAGRELALSSLKLVGAHEHWRPLTLDAEATMRALGAMLLPLAVFLYVSWAGAVQRRQLLAVLIATAGLSGLAGALQLALGHPDWLSFYDGPSVGAASGFFANPNHQALLMASAMVASAIFARTESRDPRNRGASRNRWLAWLAIGFFAIMTLGSGSRAGVVLLGIGLPGALLVVLGRGSLLKWSAVLLGALSLLSAVILLYPGTNSLGVRESFRVGEDARYAYLPDILFTLEQYWGAGSGLGTFATVFAPNENLDLAQRGFLNHAHNDVLEWLIETGLPGTVWLAAALIVLAWQIYRSTRRGEGQQAPQIGALLIIFMVGLHSLADYPLRTTAIAVVTAMSLGLAMPMRTIADRPKTRRHAGLLIAVMLGAALLSAEMLRLHVARWAFRKGDSALLARLSPASPQERINAATRQLNAGKAAAAEQTAALAVVGQPLNPAALRLLAQALEAQDKEAAGVWTQASMLGWRDGGTQLWAFQQALLQRELETAVLRADALMRTSDVEPRFVRLLRTASADREFAEALAPRTRSEPRWRQVFFNLGPKPSSAEVRGLEQMIDAMIKAGVEPSRSDVRTLITHFLSKQDYRRASEIDRLVVGDRITGSNLLDDGGFDRSSDDYSRGSTPFDWQLAAASGTSASIDTAPPSRLIADTDGERTAVAAHRYIALKPGVYRLTFRAMADADEAFQLRLLCPPNESVGQVDIAEKFNLEPVLLNFTIPGKCPAVRLVIESISRGRPAIAEFDDFELVQIGPDSSVEPLTR